MTRRRTGALVLLFWFSLNWLAGASAQVGSETTTGMRKLLAAAEKGDAKAQTALGTVYAQGLGVPRDNRLAAVWFRRAADQGNAVAQHDLGVMYAAGDGVPQDFGLAVNWHRNAADQGLASAQS